MAPWRSRAGAASIELVPALSRRAAPYSPNSAVFPSVQSLGRSLICPTGLANLPSDRYMCGGSARPEQTMLARFLPPIAAFILASSLALPAAAQTPMKDEFQTAAPYAILIDAESGTVLFEKNADKLNPPASMSKLMTIEVVLHTLEEGKLKWDDEMTISENAWRKGGAPSGGSAMFAALNSRVSVRDLLHGVMIQSGNDACIALAEGIAGSEIAFADLMNKRARELGLTQSHFSNATGVHEPDHLVTMRELAKLTQHIIKTYPEAYKIFAEREFTWNKVRQQNRNPLLAMGIGADGLKTGHTKEAGYGLAAS